MTEQLEELMRLARRWANYAAFHVSGDSPLEKKAEEDLRTALESALTDNGLAYQYGYMDGWANSIEAALKLGEHIKVSPAPQAHPIAANAISGMKS
jgi:hypothetical protein